MSSSVSNNRKRGKKISIKQLESQLQELENFKKPKVELEQYATPPHIAALMLNTIDSTYAEIADKLVADLGCGTGKLAIGSLLCDARLVYGFDIDRESLCQSLDNINYTFGDCNYDSSNSESVLDDRCDSFKSCKNFQLIQVDLAATECDGFWSSFNNYFDTVIMNPPFGTKQNSGLDMIFLRRAVDISRDVVYSLHKSSTRNFILDKCKQWEVQGKPIAQIRYNLENTYKFHKKKSVDVDVDLWRIKKKVNYLSRGSLGKGLL